MRVVSKVRNLLSKFGHARPLGSSLCMRRTHSLTHCCAWPAEGRSVLHIERSWPAIQAVPTDRPVSSSNCCSQFLRGRPGGLFQSAAGGVPVWASIDSWSACKAGVFSSRRQMWPNNEWRLSAIRDGISGSFDGQQRLIHPSLWRRGHNDNLHMPYSAVSFHMILSNLPKFEWQLSIIWLLCLSWASCKYRVSRGSL